MSPRIEATRRLREARQVNRFRQSEIARRFSEICARGGFGAETPIAVAAAVQVFRENPFLAPTPLDFPREDCFITLAKPTAALPAGCNFHKLLRDCRSSGNNALRFQIARDRAGACVPVHGTVFVKMMII